MWLSLGMLSAITSCCVLPGQAVNPSSPFQVFWQAVTERCSSEFAIHIEEELRRYGVVVNPGGDGWTGQNTTIFGSSHLGYYPRIVYENGTLLNGGVPQAANLTAHLAKVRADIKARIPWEDFSGLAVIDWEAWRPMWDRDWDAMRAYQNLSENLVRKQHPSWSEAKVTRKAKKRFQAAAKRLMKQTLKVAQSVRPAGKWGFYLFPHCYNKPGITECPDVDKQLNDRLAWLFQASGALYPSAYFKDTYNTSAARSRVYGEVGEARRVRAGNMDQQIYIYSRFTYVEGNHNIYYSSSDIYNSIGMAALLGASGVILWDDQKPARNATTCTVLHKFIQTTLGPGVQTATQFSQLCSRDLCSSHGRCVLSSGGPQEARRLLQELRASQLPSPGDSISWPTTSRVMTAIWNILFQPYGDTDSAATAGGEFKTPGLETDASARGTKQMEDALRGFAWKHADDFGCDCYSGWTGPNCVTPVTVT